MTNEKAIMCLEDMKIKVPIPKAAKQAMENNEALDVAIKALKKEPHWIPVTERLPDNDRNVLITSKGGVSMAWYNGSYFEKGASTHHRKMETVTAWAELPEPYKGVTT